MRRFLDTADKGSTGNMWKHAKHCWSDNIIQKADEAKDEHTLDDIRKGLAEAKKKQDGSIMGFFDRSGKGKLKYMARQHTYKEARSVLLEIMQAIITDKRFIVLNMFVGALRVCGASGLLMMLAFIV